MTSDRTLTRRRYSATAKAQIVAECDIPGATVAKVAMSHGINANVVHRWRQLARQNKPLRPANTGEFIPLLPVMAPPPAPTSAQLADIRVELRRGALSLTVMWPVSCTTDFTAWTRGLLQ